jgi:5-methylcytosine-specific restriction endonuclease McrA
MSKNYEAGQACTVCGLSADGMVTFHHVYTRKAYPEHSEKEFNLMPLCAWHHVETHKIGTVSFSKKYSVVNDWLITHGWELIMGRWIWSDK